MYTHAYIHTYIHTYIHACIHAYIYTYRHTYIPKKKSVYNKERYEQNQEETFKYRRERYWTIHRRDLNIGVRDTGQYKKKYLYTRLYLYIKI